MVKCVLVLAYLYAHGHKSSFCVRRGIEHVICYRMLFIYYSNDGTNTQYSSTQRPMICCSAMSNSECVYVFVVSYFLTWSKARRGRSNTNKAVPVNLYTIITFHFRHWCLRTFASILRTDGGHRNIVAISYWPTWWGICASISGLRRSCNILSYL